MGVLDFLRRPRITLQDRNVISQWENRNPPRKIISTPEGMEQYPSLPYNLFNLSAIFHPYNNVKQYLITGANKETAIREITSLNAVLRRKRKEDPDFPPFKIDPDNLRFDPPQTLEGDDFCTFEFNPYTPKGKRTKYPLTVRFQTLSSDESYRAAQTKTRKNIFGSVSYLADGTIGKYDIICWRGCDMWRVKESVK